MRSAPVVVTLALLAMLVVAFVLSFLLGPAGLSAGALFDGLWNGQGAAGTIAREIRLPRAALALVVGAALGASGAALQGLFRNPLAEPGVTGVTSSAGLGAVIALYFGLAAGNPYLLPLFAILGALASAGSSTCCRAAAPARWRWFWPAWRSQASQPR
jgi:iron complex transport system permease protein